MEITRKNFTEELENITNNLRRSCFIAFDAEFTALLTGECFKHRLFDSNAERYDKIKDEVSKMIISQVGLTMFQYDRDRDGYNAVGYTFHLCPQVLGDIDQSFIFQASTLKFLCKHNFNFNKFIYEGIPYLSKLEEDAISQQVKNNNLAGYLTSSLEISEEKELQDFSNKVSEWLHSSEDGTMYIDVQNPIQRYLIHTEVRRRFPNVLTTDSLGNSNKILIYRDKNIKGAINAPIEILEINLLDTLSGFSNIIRLLAQYKKPIIGHNLFMDLLLLHNQFIGPLPKKYCVFKNNIHNIFPVVFDTKYISHDMAKKLTLDEVWQSNILQDLYEFFAKGNLKKLQNGINCITLVEPFKVNQSYHEAGWDSYCSGFCFIRLGQWAACDNMGLFRSVGPREKLAALSSYCNKVNVIRGATPYMSLVENDPPTHRPNLLHFKSLKERVMNIDKVASAVAGCGPADVRVLGRRAALVAAGTHSTADRILEKFKDSREYSVSTYKPLSRSYGQSPALRLALWSGALITGSLLLVLLQRVKS